MERKSLNLVYEIRKHEDKTGHSLFAFCQPPRDIDITQFSTEIYKHRAKITWKMPESHLFVTPICL